MINTNRIIFKVDFRLFKQMCNASFIILWNNQAMHS
jgi:hypothetical protein